MEATWKDYLITQSTAVTHAGKFHADDVFSTALLRYVNPTLKVIRVNQVPEELDDGIVFDIGRGEFDHHQLEKEYREDGIPYAAFGLLWRKLGKELIGEEEAERFDRRFVAPLDENDNYGTEHAIARIISNFNPCWDEERSADDAFEEAVKWALPILQNEFAQIFARLRAKNEVEQVLPTAKDRILVLPRSLPWKSVVMETEIEFVIYPSNRGGYCGQAVPNLEDKNTLKCRFLEDWGGFSDEELQEISGIETASFCHSSGFLFVAKTLEDVLKACRISQENRNDQHIEEVFINFSKSSSNSWTQLQRDKASEYGTIIDLTYPDVSVQLSEEERKAVVEDYTKQIMSYHPKMVLCQEVGIFAYAMIRSLRRKRIKVVTMETPFVDFSEYF